MTELFVQTSAARPMSYVLTTAVKRLLLGGDWVRRTIASLRWRLIQIAGKVVRHGRQIILWVCGSHFELFRTMRQRLALLPAPGWAPTDNGGGQSGRTTSPETNRSTTLALRGIRTSGSENMPVLSDLPDNYRPLNRAAYRKIQSTPRLNVGFRAAALR